LLIVFISFSNLYLLYFFSEGYRPLPGLVAIFSMLVVIVLEIVLTIRGAGHLYSYGGAWDAVLDEEEVPIQNTNGSAKSKTKTASGRLGKLGLNHRPILASLLYGPYTN